MIILSMHRMSEFSPVISYYSKFSSYDDIAYSTTWGKLNGKNKLCRQYEHTDRLVFKYNFVSFKWYYFYINFLFWESRYFLFLYRCSIGYNDHYISIFQEVSCIDHWFHFLYVILVMFFGINGGVVARVWINGYELLKFWLVFSYNFSEKLKVSENQMSLIRWYNLQILSKLVLLDSFFRVRIVLKAVFQIYWKNVLFINSLTGYI